MSTTIHDSDPFMDQITDNMIYKILKNLMKMLKKKLDFPAEYYLDYNQLEKFILFMIPVIII